MGKSPLATNPSELVVLLLVHSGIYSSFRRLGPATEWRALPVRFDCLEAGEQVVGPHPVRNCATLVTLPLDLTSFDEAVVVEEIEGSPVVKTGAESVLTPLSYILVEYSDRSVLSRKTTVERFPDLRRCKVMREIIVTVMLEILSVKYSGG